MTLCPKCEQEAQKHSARSRKYKDYDEIIDKIISKTLKYNTYRCRNQSCDIKHFVNKDEKAKFSSRYGYALVEYVLKLKKTRTYEAVYIYMKKKYRIRIPITTLCDWRNNGI